MVAYMKDKKIQTLDDVRVFLEGTSGIEFAILGSDHAKPTLGSDHAMPLITMYLTH